MPLVAPNLDDRTFADLLEEAKRRLVRTCPGWTDLTPSDPGIVLLELFAYLTEIMLYRLNRLPDKAYVEFLRLMGVRLQPPSAATVSLRFSRTRADDTLPIEIPRGFRVTVARADNASEAPIFRTERPVRIEPGTAAVEVVAQHYEEIEAELAGAGTGLPGLSVTAARPPIIAPTGDELDLVVGIEAAAGELEERAPALRYGNKTYRIWREVPHFTTTDAALQSQGERYVYMADRVTGTISFAPAVRMMDASGYLQDTRQPLAAIPALGREIRLWYRRGGGPDGNVAALTLTTLKDTLPGVEVSNPRPAVGGRAGETLENALLRGPQEIHSLERAVTAKDFEILARRSSGAVGRVKAFTRATLWKYAAPGTVEVLLVPYLDERMRDGRQVTASLLQEHETETARSAIQQALDERRPLGTTCFVNWARYKTVKVTARVVAHREEDYAALRDRVLKRLYDTINPLPSGSYSGWRFGQALRAFHVYDIAIGEPGVSYVDQVRLLVDEVPSQDVRCIDADSFQPKTWYAGSQSALFRSLNDGDGWEPAGRFHDEAVDLVSAHNRRPGVLAVTTRPTAEENTTRIQFSLDSGETWRMAAQVNFLVEDIGWTLREDVPVLLMATNVGLYELSTAPDAVPIQVLVDPDNQNRGFYAVAVIVDARGGVSVAVAADGLGGLYLSSEAGRPNTFRSIGLKGEDVRVLAVQTDGPRTFLWAGVAAAGGDPGKGCFRVEILGSALSAEGWKPYQKEWRGGSCRGLTFQGLRAVAATFQAGVLWLDTGKADPSWERPDIGCGLPQRDVGRVFQRVDAIAASRVNAAADGAVNILLAGGPNGVYRSKDGGVSYERSSSLEYLEKVTLPDTWLFCSGEHEITVVGEDETNRD